MTRYAALVQAAVLTKWTAGGGSFVIWGAGRDGRAFFNGLDPSFRERFGFAVMPRKWH